MCYSGYMKRPQSYPEKACAICNTTFPCQRRPLGSWWAASDPCRFDAYAVRRVEKMRGEAIEMRGDGHSEESLGPRSSQGKSLSAA